MMVIGSYKYLRALCLRAHAGFNPFSDGTRLIRRGRAKRKRIVRALGHTPPAVYRSFSPRATNRFHVVNARAFRPAE